MAASAATESQPVILFVHGAHVTPAVYAPFIDHVRATTNWAIECPRLPTSTAWDAGPDSATDYLDDVRVIKERLDQLVLADGRSVLLMAHSAGGMVATAAAAGPAFSRKHRAKAGLDGGLIALLYVSAFMVKRGETLSAHLGKPQADQTQSPWSKIPDPLALFFHDCPAWVNQDLSPLLVPYSKAALAVTLPGEGWRYADKVYYAVCVDDRAITPAGQFGMVEAIRAEGIDVQVEEMAAAHFPFFSKTAETTALLQKIMAEAGFSMKAP